MDAETRVEFERRDKLNMWLGGLALSVSVTFGSCALERAFTAHAQVASMEERQTNAAAKDQEHDAAIEKATETRERVIRIEGKVEGIVGTLADQQRILEEIRREVRK